MDYKSLVEGCEGFHWDEGNQDKNWHKHRVSDSECEQIFFNEPLIIASDIKHSQHELRYYALGQTNAQRLLFLAFCLRENLIRVISARDMNSDEGEFYQHAENQKEDPEL